VCGPSGVGKSTLIARLRAEYPDDFGFSVSHTTRAPRPGEEDGVAYFFTSKPDMEAGIAAGRFLEHANVHGNLYGTSYAAIERVSAAGRVCILDIDVQGVASCRRAGFPIGKYVFVAPPDTAVLETRLRGRGECGGCGRAAWIEAVRQLGIPLTTAPPTRLHLLHPLALLPTAGTETEENIAKRLANASKEIAAAVTVPWDSWVVNDDLDDAYLRLKAAIDRV
jgi:guanylate kinase